MKQLCLGFIIVLYLPILHIQPTTTASYVEDSGSHDSGSGSAGKGLVGNLSAASQLSTGLTSILNGTGSAKGHPPEPVQVSPANPRNVPYSPENPTHVPLVPYPSESPTNVPIVPYSSKNPIRVPWPPRPPTKPSSEPLVKNPADETKHVTTKKLAPNYDNDRFEINPNAPKPKSVYQQQEIRQSFWGVDKPKTSGDTSPNEATGEILSPRSAFDISNGRKKRDLSSTNLVEVSPASVETDESLLDKYDINSDYVVLNVKKVPQFVQNPNQVSNFKNPRTGFQVSYHVVFASKRKKEKKEKDKKQKMEKKEEKKEKKEQKENEKKEKKEQKENKKKGKKI